MKTINLIIDNNSKTVQVERYFMSHGNAYLIYTDSDKDADGNVKIYVAKVDENNKTVAIASDSEWDQVKKDIVGIVNDNKECSKLSVEDLDYTNLDNMEVTSVKALRLPGSVMSYLSANQPQFSHLTLEEQEQKLDEKTKSLQEMNQDLTTLMGEVEKEFSQEPQVEEPTTLDSDLENGATMEIIMPTVKENAEPKGKGKFSLKNLFGKKKPKTEDVEEKVEEKPSEEPLPDTGIVEQTELPEQALIEPIVVENTEESAMVPSFSEPSVELEPSEIKETVVDEPAVENTVINEEPSLESADILTEPQVEEPVIEAPSIFDTPSVSLEEAPVSFEIPEQEETTQVESNENEVVTEPLVDSSVEVLDTEQDDYEQKYESIKIENEQLLEQISKLQEEIRSYQEKMEQVKSIVR